MMPEVCILCGNDSLHLDAIKRYVMRPQGLKRLCRICYNGPAGLPNPFRELGFPDAAGGKIAPGNYQWRSKYGPGS